MLSYGLRVRGLQFNSLRRFSSGNTIYDLAVIGAGPGGYVASIRAAQNGLKTVCVDKRKGLGGTCLNVGCIPSKILLNATHKYHEALHKFPSMGIQLGSCTMDLATTHKERKKTMEALNKGIQGLFKLNDVKLIQGTAMFKSSQTIEIQEESGETTTIEAKNFLISTGSESSPLPGSTVVPDEKIILTSTGALELTEPPKKMVVIGAGAIGLELGSVYNRLGSEIIVVEYLDRIIPTLDAEISKQFQKILSKQGFKFQLSTRVTNITIEGDKAQVHVEHTQNHKTNILDCDKVLIAVGRRPFTDKLNLAALHVDLDKGGRIPVDDQFRLPGHSNIYAVGDVIRGPMLAHKAEDEGVAVADLIAQKTSHINYEAIPSIVYTNPEVAGVGKTEEELKLSQIVYRKGTFPFGSNSRARIQNEMDGFVKILTDKQTDKLLGAWILGPSAGELIHELVVGIDRGATSEDIARACHAHPTLSEAVREGCLSAHFKAIHSR